MIIAAWGLESPRKSSMNDKKQALKNISIRPILIDRILQQKNTIKFQIAIWLIWCPIEVKTLGTGKKHH